MSIRTAKIKRMYVLSFLFTLHMSLSAYVNSTFLTKVIPEQYVGILYTIASVVTLVLLSKNANLLKYFGNRRLVLWLLVINMLSLVGLITSQNPYIISASFIALMSTNTLVLFCIDIFIEHFGDPKTIGKTRGLYLTITNIAWMMSPLITSLLITQEGGYKAIYLLAFIATIIMTLGLLFSVRRFHDKTYEKTPFLQTYKYLKTNRHMLAITVINFILQFFYAWMVVYTPLYLIKHIGFGWDQLGVIFTIMLAPFVLFGLPVGILIDRFHVKKRTILAVGFFIISVSTFLIGMISIKSLALWALVLFLTRMGASIIETTSEIYFFTHITEEESYLLGVYRDMSPVAYIIAPLIATIVFMIFPFKFLFIILAVILLSGFYYITQLRHSSESTVEVVVTE